MRSRAWAERDSRFLPEYQYYEVGVTTRRLPIGSNAGSDCAAHQASISGFGLSKQSDGTMNNGVHVSATSEAVELCVPRMKGDRACCIACCTNASREWLESIELRLRE